MYRNWIFLEGASISWDSFKFCRIHKTINNLADSSLQRKHFLLIYPASFPQSVLEGWSKNKILFPDLAKIRILLSKKLCPEAHKTGQMCSSNIYACVPPQLLNCTVGIFTSLSLTIQLHWLTGISNIMREDNKRISLSAFSKSCIILCTYVLFPLVSSFRVKILKCCNVSP